jgi:hypothetical protein
LAYKLLTQINNIMPNYHNKCGHRISNGKTSRYCKRSGGYTASDGTRYCAQHLVDHVERLPKALVHGSIVWVGQHQYFAMRPNNRYIYYKF